MSQTEARIIDTYKNAVDFYNMFMEDGDTSYASGYILGMEEMAKAFGYVLYAHHRNDCVGLPYEYVSIAREGNVLEQLNI